MPLLILLLIALLVNSVGFRYFVHFLNVGYAFSIIGMCLAAVAMFWHLLDWYAALHLFGLLVWGLRLGVFVLRRERQPAYHKELQAIQHKYGNIRWPVKSIIWVVVSALYVLMFLPSFYHAGNPANFSAPISALVELVGLALLFGGLIIETLADRQKSKYKQQNPHRYCDTGFYRQVRYPNYMGEIIIWVGSWIAGVPYFHTIWHWLGSLTGLVIIILIMVGTAKRLEHTQDERYGDMPEYQAYIESVPVLFPGVPLYTLRNTRFFLG